ncbi:MAG: ECF transporter S component, partial [Treponema sp.]|nr:ECF transporter S component [Treponema sp.]
MFKISVKTVVAIGIGAALMFVLMRFVAIPSGVPIPPLTWASQSLRSLPRF